MVGRPGRRAALLVVFVAVLAAPVVLVRLALPDAPPPAALGRPIRDFSDAIWHLFERSPLTYARYVDIETGPDNLVVLYFEVRPYPYLAADSEVYLVSRCTPIAALGPIGVGGGTVIGSRADDAELEFLRSDAQPPCEAATP